MFWWSLHNEGIRSFSNFTRLGPCPCVIHLESCRVRVWWSRLFTTPIIIAEVVCPTISNSLWLIYSTRQTTYHSSIQERIFKLQQNNKGSHRLTICFLQPASILIACICVYIVGFVSLVLEMFSNLCELP